MLKNIPNIIPPELMKCMMEMGHSDTIVLTDANFPCASNAKRLIRVDGVEVTDLLDAILQFFPLDDFIDDPVTLMQYRDCEPRPEIWADFDEILKRHDKGQAYHQFNQLGRLDFYKQACDAYVIVQTATTARYANLILQKGVL